LSYECKEGPPQRNESSSMEETTAPTSPRPQPSATPAVPEGVVIIAKKNRKNRFFLASKENTFGPVKVEVVMIDSGCNTNLLSLAVDDIKTLPDRFPQADFIWDIVSSHGVQSWSLTLRVAPKLGNIPVHLCKDIIPTEQPTWEVAFLRFHLCNEDVQWLNNSSGLLPASSLLQIREFLGSNLTVGRRTHALLGQSLLSSFSSIQHRGVIVVVDPVRFVWNGWRAIADLEVFVDASARFRAFPGFGR